MKLLGKKQTPKIEPDKLIGKSIKCMDGITRRIFEIHPSIQHRDMFVINENDPDSKMGYFVHSLEVTCKALNQPPPSEEAKAAASRLWRTMVIADARDLYSRTVKGQKIPFSFED